MDLFDLRSASRSETQLNKKQIVDLVEKGEFPFYSEVYSHETKIWQALYENTEMARLVGFKLLEAASSFNYNSLFHHWCLRDHPSPSGSYTMLEVVELCQKKILNSKSQIRHPTISDWVDLGSLPSFDTKNLEALYKFVELRASFKPRENPRVSIKKDVYVSKGDKVYQGICWSLSTQGLGFDTIETTNFEVGDALSLTLVNFEKGQDVRFECQIVSVIKKSKFDSIGVKFDDNDVLSDEILGAMDLREEQI